GRRAGGPGGGGAAGRRGVGGVAEQRGVERAAKLAAGHSLPPQPPRGGFGCLLLAQTAHARNYVRLASCSTRPTRRRVRDRKGNYLGVSLRADSGHVSKIGRGPSMYEMEGPRLPSRLRRRPLGGRVLRGPPPPSATRPKLRFPGASDAPGSPPAGARLQW